MMSSGTACWKISVCEGDQQGGEERGGGRKEEREEEKRDRERGIGREGEERKEEEKREEERGERGVKYMMGCGSECIRTVAVKKLFP